MSRPLGACGVAAVLLAGAAASQARFMTYEDARPVLERVSAGVPRELRDLRGADAGTRFAAWAARRDREIRARVAGGDDDSLVNLWLYGTSFTSLPRAVATDGADVEDLARQRLDAFLQAAARADGNERLAFARTVLTERGFDLAAPGGRSRAAEYLMSARRRMQAEFAATAKTLAAAASEPAGGGTTAAFATIFSGRGLSSDTSILPARGVAAALEAIRAQGLLRAGVRRLAIVGPGLDFTNKADGYDFYPQQTVQPFAAVDTLRRLGLAAAGLEVTTFDLSARVNQHLAAARARAAAGSGYVITLPLETANSWNAALVEYWTQLGGMIGDEVPAAVAPAAAGAVRARAVRIAPAVVSAITARDLNIVLQRLALAEDERFDLVIATNVLVYYDVFEQALAAANIASMLRPGGVLLTNTAVLPTPPLKASAQYLRVAYTDKEYDEFFWYQNN